ncbi:MAG: hypothetical protein M3O02_04200 [Acidobacteriota bacterium]|nr:hypothetical protein [Acidobacteriota bacterium]
MALAIGLAGGLLADAQPPGAKFKVGDRVMASPTFSSNPQAYRPCTITGYASNGYYAKCDPWNGLPVSETFVSPDYTRAAPNMAAAPVAPACSFDPPAGPVSRSSAALEKVFGRVIYDWFAQSAHEGVTNPLKVGVTFQEFQMGSPYANRVVNDPARGAQRMHDGAPVGATVYPVKAKFVVCSAYRDSVEREVRQQSFSCFKDRSGDWTCPSDSNAVVGEKSSTPVGR